MLDLTSTLNRFRRFEAEGDFYAALGVAPKAKSLDIDVAAARLAETAPWMATEISAVVNVLTHRQCRAAYDAVRELRDHVLADLGDPHQAAFATTFADYRADVWRRCCRFLRFDPAQPESPKLGPRGRESLVVQGRALVAHEFLRERVAVVWFTSGELAKGIARRDVWQAGCACGQTDRAFYRLRPPNPAAEAGGAPGELPESFRPLDYVGGGSPCPRCHATGQRPAAFVDRVDFTLPEPAGIGRLVRGESVLGGGTCFAIINRFNGTELRPGVIEHFFGRQDVGHDITLDQAAATLPRVYTPTANVPAATGAGKSASFWDRIKTFALIVGILLALGILGSREGAKNNAPKPPPYQTPAWTLPRPDPPKVDFPRLDPEILKRLEDPAPGDRELRLFTPGEAVDPKLIDMEIKRNWQRESRGWEDRDKHLRAAQRARSRGERLWGYLEAGRLEIDLLAPYQYSAGAASPLRLYVESRDGSEPIPRAALTFELNQHNRDHACQGSCLVARRLAGFLRAVNRGETVTVQADGAKLKIEAEQHPSGRE